MDFEFVKDNLMRLAGVMVPIILTGMLIGRNQKQKKKQRQEQNPFESSQPQRRPDARSMYYDTSYEQVGAAQPPKGKKKKRKSTPVLQSEGRPVEEALGSHETAPQKTKSMPVFSQDPVVNGIVWAEILTRGGTKRGSR